ncbi:Os01g0662925 [Oryza sativa Japonica Group]|uniref:Os01g0662925 protein n=1 Tax=Oryza sativa subsp. japonica TaxID=39947 RepID=A0A0P0V690_ORYSJ|nr:Os01g0662925 [Oryza sativa Japonica Group]
MRVDARAGARRMSHVCLAFLLVDRSAWLAGWLAWGVVKDGSKERPRETGNSLRRSIWGRGGRAGWCIAPNYSLCGSSAGYSSSLHWVSPITRGTVRSVPESSYPLCWALWDPQAGHHHHRGQTSWQSSHDDEDMMHGVACIACMRKRPLFGGQLSDESRKPGAASASALHASTASCPFYLSRDDAMDRMPFIYYTYHVIV